MRAMPVTPGPLLSAAGPVAFGRLAVGEVLQPAVVHLADVARDDLAGLGRRELGSSRLDRADREGRQGEPDRAQASKRDFRRITDVCHGRPPCDHLVLSLTGLDVAAG